ncbi:unnamed protein product [Bemisia tabaci]|uniref:Eukaryotic translation initiation factor 3 subunit K n=1 Tax=Bemisia tabaci TaxID=7038 RepID=A0A9P0F318_BEMTA|nr:unnamed protein product [Bemisia tabaci]
MAEAMRQEIASMLKGIQRYNPDNLQSVERYVTFQAKENAYDLEANLAVLKFYQFNQSYDIDMTCTILLKALTNLPHTDFVLCKCLLNEGIVQESNVSRIIHLANLLESCDFKQFWARLREIPELHRHVVGFQDSIRKFVCHVIGITFQTINKNLLAQLLGDVDSHTLNQWIQKYNWSLRSDGYVFVANQEACIKTKNITENIAFDSVMNIMKYCRQG